MRGRWILFLILLTAAPAGARPLPSAGARALALGGAYTAVNDDVNVLFHNPAGLMGLTGPEFALNYGRLDVGRAAVVTEGHAAFGMPYHYKKIPLGVAGGFMGQSLASGAHIFDLYGGAAMDVPTRGIVPWPVKGGGALKIRHQNGDDLDNTVGESSLSFGLDGGVLVPFNAHTTLGVTLRDLFPPGANPAGPQLRVGAQQLFGQRALVLADVEVRRGVTSLKIGSEWFFYKKLLRLRIGNGFKSGRTDLFAVGAGFNFSPAQFDIAYLIPTRTLNDNAGQIRVSFLYKFNAPKFSELYFDRALDMAEELDRKLVQMGEKESQLKANIEDLEQARRLAEEDLSRQSVRQAEAQREIDERLVQAQNRAAEMEDKAKSLEDKVRAAEEKIRQARSAGARPAESGPRRRTHLAQAGDTLRALAEKYYGDPDRWKDIYNANQDKINRGRPIPGMTLVIP